MHNPIMEHFTYAHLGTQYMKDVSKQFSDLAWRMEAELDDGPEKSVALRKLLEAKDAAVRQARLSEKNNQYAEPKKQNPYSFLVDTIRQQLSTVELTEREAQSISEYIMSMSKAK